MTEPTTEAGPYRADMACPRCHQTFGTYTRWLAHWQRCKS